MRNEKARLFILRMQNKDEELQRNEGFDEKFEAFDNFLMECKEALQSLKEDLNAEIVSNLKCICYLKEKQNYVYLFLLGRRLIKSFKDIMKQWNSLTCKCNNCKYFQ